MNLFLSVPNSRWWTRLCAFVAAVLLWGASGSLNAAVDPASLLPPEKAFAPQVFNNAEGIRIDFAIAEGYYLYRDKISVSTTPKADLAPPKFPEGVVKKDEFFGEQTIYKHRITIPYAYSRGLPNPYTLKITYQGCAEAGICYPPATSEFFIDREGVIVPKGADMPLNGMAAPRHNVPAGGVFDLGQPGGKPLWSQLLGFFLAGLGLSFTACMYPLLPIVSSIVVGGRPVGKARAFALALTYTQGLALTYTVVGVAAGLTGSLLTVFLQQRWVLLTAAALLVLLALAMFGVVRLQMPARLQSWFHHHSNRLSGGRLASVFAMGMVSALIVGPCVAPPLAFALGYIGQSGNALLGGAALYALALGTGVPLVAVAVFGSALLPRAGNWMRAIQAAFSLLMLAAAVYVASPFLPYALAVAAYTLLLVIPGIWLLYRALKISGSLKSAAMLPGLALCTAGMWFGGQSLLGETTMLHRWLTLVPPAQQQSAKARHFTDVAAWQEAVNTALKQQPNEPVLVDFYADWCATCREMQADTLKPEVLALMFDPKRLFTLDVTANTPQQQQALKRYGLYGPPGVFLVRADGSHSAALLGYAKPDDFAAWLKAN